MTALAGERVGGPAEPTPPGRKGATFAVDTTVRQQTAPLPPLERDDGNFWGGIALKACSQLPAHAVDSRRRCSTNMFAEAIALAFFDHYALELAPEGVWLAIMQGLAVHVKNNAEQLRSQFVSHEGQDGIEVVDPSMRWTSPPEVWGRNIARFEEEIRKKINPAYAARLCPTFSTSTAESRIATTVCLMDMMQHYFAYGMRGGCGIPAITLLGTTDDWERVLVHAREALTGLQCDWWRDALVPVLEEFVAAAKGSANAAFWKRTCTYVEGSGQEVPFSGWVNVFFPYIKGGGANPAREPLPPMPRAEHRFDVQLKALSGKVTTVSGVTELHSFVQVMRACGEFGVPVVNGARVSDLTSTLGSCGVANSCTILLMSSCVETEVPNPALRKGGGMHGVNPSRYPSGMSSAPVTYKEGTAQWPVTFKAGFTCITQDPDTLAVRAGVGWGVVHVNR